jgi:glycosyltransferase involved in cell wall biosynthesis
MSKTSKCQLSVISPVYNEEKNLYLLYKKLTLELKNLHLSWEIIFVNDGSKDRSGEILQDLAKENIKVKVIEFSRNFGQTAAIVAGIKNSKGRIIIVIDSDLQNDPSDFKKY